VGPDGRVAASRAVTDLALGLGACELARRSARPPAASGSWRAALWCTGASALVGAVHHAARTDDPRAAHIRWRIIGVLLSVAMGLMLIASVRQTLGRRAGRLAVAPAIVGPVAYAGSAVRGGGGLPTLVAVQSGTMAGIVLTWVVGVRRGHPAAPTAILAICLGIGAAMLRAVTPRSWARFGVDADAVYHLAQIPGLVALARAARTG